MPRESPRHGATPVPRHSLVTDVLELLRQDVRRGEWKDWLPGERKLGEIFQVSRGTLRVALKNLQQEGLVISHPGRGNRVRQGPFRTRRLARTYSVGLILPGPIQNMRQTTALWIDALRTRLFGTGFQLTLHEGRQWYRSNAGHELEKLASSGRHDCWILAFATHFMQDWFHHHRVRCIVAGSCYPGINLPSIDLDHGAMGRHAAGILIAHGHRQIAFLHKGDRTPGELAMKEGFISACHSSRQGKVGATVLEHGEDVAPFASSVLRLFRKPVPPTAIIMTNSYYCSTALTALLRAGYRIPADISLICRDDDLLLQYLVPSPARYRVSHEQYAAKLFRSIQQICDVGLVRRNKMLIIPTFFRAETIAARPG